MNPITRTQRFPWRPRAALALALLVLLAATAASCGGGAQVTMKDFGFDPDTITIKRGGTVTWKNEDRRSRQIMSGAPPVMTDEFVSPVLERGQSWSHTFEQPGEYPYHDMRIPGILGTVIVEE